MRHEIRENRINFIFIFAVNVQTVIKKVEMVGSKQKRPLAQFDIKYVLEIET